MSGGSNRLPTRIVVDDTVIAADDPMSVIDPVWWTANFYDTFPDYEHSLKDFSWPQRLVWAVLWYDSEVNNGGHCQFFSNSTGMVWPEALEGLIAIEREDLAQILREAVARFPAPPSRERDEREDQLDATDAAFNDLDKRYYGSNGDLWDALNRYIKGQPESFYFDGVVKRPPHWDEPP